MPSTTTLFQMHLGMLMLTHTRTKVAVAGNNNNNISNNKALTKPHNTLKIEQLKVSSVQNSYLSWQTLSLALLIVSWHDPTELNVEG